MSSKRQIDLSVAAARQLEMLRDGVGNVRIEAIDLDQLDKLIKYFEGRPHPNLRLRPYYRPIMVPEDNLEECYFDRL
jgi:rare lipoprotein A